MTGWKVLTILHLVGWGFCALWVLGTCWKERAWGNAITWFNWFQAFWLSLVLGVFAKMAVVSFVEPKSADEFFTVSAVSLAIQWGLFIAIFAGLKTWSDKLSRVKVAFHPIFDGIANFIFCALLAVGVMGSTLELLYFVLRGMADVETNGKVPLPPELGWLKAGSGGGLPWQMATLFCGYWVAVAVAVAVLSRPSGRLDKPKKAEDA